MGKGREKARGSPVLPGASNYSVPRIEDVIGQRGASARERHDTPVTTAYLEERVTYTRKPRDSLAWDH